MEKMRFLIVEDEVLIAEHIGDILKSEGCHLVDYASNSVEARDKLSDNNYDMALLDIRVDGELSGIELAEFIRTKNKPVFIFITANSDKKIMQKALQTGPAAFLTKPFKSIDVIAAINLAISNVTNGQRAIGTLRQESAINQKEDLGTLNGYELAESGLSQFDIDRLRAINQCCENNFWDNRFNSEILASQLQVSRRQLYRFMAGVLDTTPGIFIKKFRLRKAYSFIQGGKHHRIKEVSYDVGFLKTSHFSKEFEKEFGVKPSELQSRHL